MTLKGNRQTRCISKNDARAHFIRAYEGRVNSKCPVIQDYLFRSYQDGSTLIAELSTNSTGDLFLLTFAAVLPWGDCLTGGQLNSACFTLGNAKVIWANATGQSSLAMPGWVQDQLGISEAAIQAGAALEQLSIQNN